MEPMCPTHKARNNMRFCVIPAGSFEVCKDWLTTWCILTLLPRRSVVAEPVCWEYLGILEIFGKLSQEWPKHQCRTVLQITQSGRESPLLLYSLMCSSGFRFDLGLKLQLWEVTCGLSLLVKFCHLCLQHKKTVVVQFSYNFHHVSTHTSCTLNVCSDI